MVTTMPNIYLKFVITDGKGKTILYICLQKALYGMLKSALLFYKKLVKDLEATGFRINPYDPCIANYVMNASDEHDVAFQWTQGIMQWSFPNHQAIFLSLPDPWKSYCKIVKIHDYMGMMMDYSKPEKLKVSMTKYIDKIL